MNERNDEAAIQDRYDDAFQVCYGCGAKNARGLQLKSFRRGDEVVAEYTPRPEQLGVPGVVDPLWTVTASPRALPIFRPDPTARHRAA